MVSSVVSANVERLRALLQLPAVRLVLENFLSLSSIHILGQIAMLVLVPFVTRKLGIEKFGITSFGISFVMIFQFVTVYGFNNSAARKAALHKHDRPYIQRLYSAVSVAKLLLCIPWRVFGPHVASYGIGRDAIFGNIKFHFHNWDGDSYSTV